VKVREFDVVEVVKVTGLNTPKRPETSTEVTVLMLKSLDKMTVT
jgi:hypothetical protein